MQNRGELECFGDEVDVMCRGDGEHGGTSLQIHILLFSLNIGSMTYHTTRYTVLVKMLRQVLVV